MFRQTLGGSRAKPDEAAGESEPRRGHFVARRGRDRAAKSGGEGGTNFALAPLVASVVKIRTSDQMFMKECFTGGSFKVFLTACCYRPTREIE